MGTQGFEPRSEAVFSWVNHRISAHPSITGGHYTSQNVPTLAKLRSLYYVPVDLLQTIS